ncbi:MAG: hypothetical protein ABFS22_11665 [Pseudomonadota bacterium]
MATLSDTELLHDVEQTIAESQSEDAMAVIKRSVETILSLSQGKRLSVPKARRMLHANDAELLGLVAEHVLEREPLGISKRARLRLQGRLRFRDMLKEAGGVYTAAEVSDLLGITEDAIRKRASARKLIAVRQGEHFVYPVWQFSSDGTVPNFETVLQLLEDDHYVDQCRFFLTPDADLGQSPIEALSTSPDQLELIQRKARQFGQQGAR